MSRSTTTWHWIKKCISRTADYIRYSLELYMDVVVLFISGAKAYFMTTLDTDYVSRFNIESLGTEL
jgi:hypothetical protein